MSQQHTILIADDDPSIRALFSQVLTSDGYEVNVCENGAEAIGKIKDSIFDMLLLDLDMGEISGIDVLKKAKEIDPDVVVIIITGNPSLDTAIEALKLNAYDYVQKPCLPTDLSIKVKRGLEYFDQKKKIETFEKFLHFCGICKKVCKNIDHKGSMDYWVTIEKYLAEKAQQQSYLGYCPDCIDSVKEQIEKE